MRAARAALTTATRTVKKKRRRRRRRTVGLLSLSTAGLAFAFSSSSSSAKMEGGPRGGSSFASAAKKPEFAEMMSPPPFVFETGGACDKSIVFLHGLGDTGRGWSDVPQQSQLRDIPNARWIFPNAPMISVTLNAGMTMPGWFDMNSLERENLVDDEGRIDKAWRFVDALIEDEVSKGISPSKIVVGGFSQGGAIALTHALTSKYNIAGYVGLSTYLPMADSYAKEGMSEKKGVKVFQAHGTADPVLRFDYGASSCEKLKSLGLDVQFESYAGMAHSACAEELDDWKDFMKKLF